ncbi:TetR/AcrR family transcriptional regulator [Euzebya sp.]|uniref:TetR/AcrR family transcriptional regulator n=1 Tax=Euzebya sp. TaxID=1971409 RepID=UPI003519355C
MSDAAGDTGTQILDATLEVLADVGLARLGLEDVAVRAGVSRQTVYRWFGNRRGLVAATVLREEQRLLAEVTATAAAHDGLTEALTAALTALLTWTREHPLLGRLLAEEADLLLPPLASGDATVLAVGRAAIIEVLADRLGGGADPTTAADVLARVMLSYAIDPPTDPPEVVAAAIAHLLVHGIGAVSGGSGSAPA